MKKVIFLIFAFFLHFGISAQVSPGQPYKIQSKNSGKFVDASGYSVVQSTAGTTWKFIQKPGGWYQIKHSATNKFIANLGKTRAGDPIKLTNQPGDGALWKPEAIGGGYYRLRNKQSRKCIANSNKTGSGVQLVQFATVQAGGHWKFVSNQTGGNTVHSGGINPGDNGLTLEIENGDQVTSGTAASGLATSLEMKKNFLHNIGLPEEAVYFSFVEEAVRRQLRSESGRNPTSLQIRNKLNSMSETGIEDRTFVILHLKNMVVEIAGKRESLWTSPERQLINYLAQRLRQQNIEISRATLSKWNEFKSNTGIKPATQLGMVFGSAVTPDPNEFNPPTGYEGLSHLQKNLIKDFMLEAQNAGVEAAVGGSIAIAVPGAAVSIASGIMTAKIIGGSQVIFLLGGKKTMLAVQLAKVTGGSIGGTGAGMVSFSVAVPVTVTVLSAVLIGYEAYRIQKAREFEKKLEDQAYWAQGRVDIPSIASNPESLEALWTKMDYYFAASMNRLKSFGGGGMNLQVVNPSGTNHSSSEKVVTLINRTGNIFKFQVSYVQNGRTVTSPWSKNILGGGQRIIKVPMNRSNYRIKVKTNNKEQIVIDQSIPDDFYMVSLKLKGKLKDMRAEDSEGLEDAINVELQNKSALLIKFRLKYNGSQYSSWSKTFGNNRKQIVRIPNDSRDVKIEIKTNRNQPLVFENINRNQGQRYKFRGNANRPVFEGEGKIIGEGINVQLKNKTSNIVTFYLYYTDENGQQQATGSSRKLSKGMSHVISAPDVVENLNIKVRSNRGNTILDRPLSVSEQSQKLELTGSKANPKLEKEGTYVQKPGINIEMKNNMNAVVKFYCFYYQNGVQKDSDNGSGNMNLGQKRTVNVPGDIEKLYIKVYTSRNNFVHQQEIPLESKSYKLTGKIKKPKLEEL